MCSGATQMQDAEQEKPAMEVSLDPEETTTPSGPKIVEESPTNVAAEDEDQSRQLEQELLSQSSPAIRSFVPAP
mgnify:CR=1 FL=1